MPTQTHESSTPEPIIRHARDSRGNTPEVGVVKTLSELARELRAEPDMTAVLQHVVASTVAEIDGADHGGISLVEGNTIHAVAATDPIVERLDNLQETLDQGPCLSALREQITVRCDDMSADSRWPDFARAAMAEDIRSMLSVQLFVDGDNLGALNLYSGDAGAFSFDDEYSAMALAAHAAVAMKGSRVESNLRTALESRDLIGQAKGVLMERYKIGPDEAFALLVTASQRTHYKLRELAEHLAATGELRTEYHPH